MIKSRHRKAYREGKFNEIPADILEQLGGVVEPKKEEPKKKEKKEDKDIEKDVS